MKLLAFIWLYLTDPMFRFYQDFYSKQESIDKLKKAYEDNLRWKSTVMFVHKDK